ncbi:unnamed protein product, partial [Pylaiella littoralis]
SLFGGLFVLFVYECTPSVFVPSLYLLFYFICLSSIDHIVTGPSPWFAFALVCHGSGPWFDVRSTFVCRTVSNFCFFFRACYFFCVFGVVLWPPQMVPQRHHI